MKIRLTCQNCGRDSLVQQVLDSQGHCPWCGKAFQPHYTAVLAEDLHQAELAGSAMEAALERIAGMDPALVFDQGSILGRIQASLEELEKGRKPAPA
ncbi:MAG: hypothetical protein M3Q23_03500 [Actinomycetota bacterium]|nr:hypothetical protein [Actinomycetota bacterium]